MKNKLVDLRKEMKENKEPLQYLCEYESSTKGHSTVNIIN